MSQNHTSIVLPAKNAYYAVALPDLNTNLTCFICASKLEISHLK